MLSTSTWRCLVFCVLFLFGLFDHSLSFDGLNENASQQLSCDLCIQPTQIAGCVNLLDNPSFEETKFADNLNQKGYTEANPSQWDVNVGKRVQRGHKSTYAMTTRQGSGNKTPLVLSQLVSVDCSVGWLALSAWVQAETSSSQAWVQLGASAQVPSDMFVGVCNKSVTADSSWHQVVCTFFMVPQPVGFVHVTVVVPSSADYKIWIDDVALFKSPYVNSSSLCSPNATILKSTKRPESCMVNVKMNLFVPETPFPLSSTTICTHTEYNKIQTLIWLSEAWNGPISIVLFAPDFATANQTAYTMHQNTGSMRRWATVHIAYGSPLWTDNCQIPSNELRQRAFDGAITELVLSLNFNAMTVQTARQKIIRDINSMTDLNEQKVAWILPSFEVKHATSYPSNKNMAVEMLKNGTLEPKQFRDHIIGHYNTDAYRWMYSAQPYPVRYFPGFEPFVIVKKSEHPKFDICFDGSDGVVSQADYVYHLAALGLKFYVLPSTFLFHIRQPKPIDKTLSEQYNVDWMLKFALRAIFTREHPIHSNHQSTDP